MTTPDPFQTFRVEAQELVQELEATLLELEERPQDQDLVDRAFRALHTLKGSGAMFGPAPLAAFAHHIETAFELVRTKTRPATPRLIGYFLKAADQLRRLLDTGTADPDQEAAVIAALATALDLVMQAAAGPADATSAAVTSSKNRSWRITFKLPKQALVFGTDPARLLEELAELGSCQVTALTDALPDLDVLDPALCQTGFVVELVTDKGRQTIEDVFIFLADQAELAIEPINDQAGLPLPNGLATASPAKDVPAVPHTTPAPVHREAKAAATTVRVPASRLDALMDQVGELVIAQARLTQLAHGQTNPALDAVAEDIARLASELRDLTMGMRMLPVSTLFGRFRRVVRDLSEELGKSVELDTVGEETELDKTVIEALADPMVHLIRNAVDHGIEPAQIRQANGKSPHGRIILSARQAGTEVHIAISDDGAGLNRVRIREKALKNGLLTQDQVPSERELDLMIFEPGFSTAATVSNVSGRGVGMDVVKRTIESLRGIIDIASIQGQGSTITLKLPLTLAIIDGLLVRISGGIFVIPLAAVHECVELAATKSQGSDRRAFLNVRGELVPFVQMAQLLGQQLISVPHPMVVIAGTAAGRVGLVVDEVIGHHQTVIKTLSPLHRHIPCLGGATILGDGSVALILDVAALVHTAEGSLDERLSA